VPFFIFEHLLSQQEDVPFQFDVGAVCFEKIILNKKTISRSIMAM
jgi:hypothetical protein